jgi:hypothetical protein
LSPAASQRRAIACYKAFWAIASLSIPSDELNAAHSLDLAMYIQSIFRTSPNSGGLSNWAIHAMLSGNSDTAPYLISAWAIMQWSTFFAIKRHLIKLRECLIKYEADPNIKDSSSEVEQVSSSLNKIWEKFYMLRIQPPPPNSHSILQLRSLVEEYLAEITWLITLEFLSRSASIASAPYNWDETRFTIRVSGDVPPPITQWAELEISNIISTHMDRLHSATDLRWIDTCISELASLWRPIDPSCIPRGIIVFLNRRESELGLTTLLVERNTGLRLLNCFPITLSQGASNSLFGPGNSSSLPREDLFTALWRLASLRLDHFFDSDDLYLVYLEAVLEALSTTEFRFARISNSIVALLKIQILRAIHSRRTKTLEEAGLNHHVFPAETAIEIPDELYAMPETGDISGLWAFENFKRNRISEASIYLVAEYLEHCASDSLPYNIVKTLDIMMIIYYLPPETAIHPTHQMRLANSVGSVFVAAAGFTELWNAILNCSCWSLYAQGPKTEEQFRAHHGRVNSGDRVLWPWLDHPIARKITKEAFADYAELLMRSADQLTPTLARLQSILLGLEF